MSGNDKIAALCEELQVLAFNMAEELDTLNFHSQREVAADMRRRGVFDSLDEMRDKIRRLERELRSSGRDAQAEEIVEMDALLEVMNKSGGEPEYFRQFVSELIPLIRMLDKWGERGPIDGCGSPL
jgi:hypothetical protein